MKLKVIEMETVCLHFWQHIKHPRWALAHHTIRLLDEGVPQDAPPNSLCKLLLKVSWLFLSSSLRKPSRANM